ncbi:MAG: DUF3108 domain-containing protein [Rhodobacteraceae bacterium]|nr:DUF3108 domain-containing protein [Paracoccaceae bacterium]
MARIKGALAAAAMAAATAACAESGQFEVSFGGLKAGVLAYDASLSGGRYEMRGAVRPGGLFGLLFDAEIDSTAKGRVSGNTYRPSLARETTRKDGDTSTRTITYRGGVPSVSYDPPDKPSKHAAPPSEQKGTVDTSTAAFAILRDRPESLACQLDLVLYDGTRRQRIRLDEAQQRPGGLSCTGVYTRLAGFSPKDMAKGRDWPLRMDYDRLSDGTYRVREVSFPTSFGTARIRRTD